MRSRWSIPCVALMLLPGALHSQDNYEIQVYGSETVARGATMFELHSNYTSRGGPIGLADLSSNHALHETVEITHGFNDWFEVGFYNFMAVTPGVGMSWVGNHLRPRVAVPQSWHWKVGVSLSQEFGYQRSAYSPDSWTYELRPIIDQHPGRWYWAVNPTLEFAIKGPNAGHAPEFAPNVQLGFDVTPKLNVALEYYGTFGPLGHFDVWHETEQDLFPAINVDFGPDWEFNLATGIPLTRISDRVAVKMIIGHRFGLRRTSP